MSSIFEKIMWFVAGLVTLSLMIPGYFVFVLLAARILPRDFVQLAFVLYVPACVAGIFFIARASGCYAIYSAGIICSIVPTLFLMANIFRIPAQD